MASDIASKLSSVVNLPVTVSRKDDEYVIVVDATGKVTSPLPGELVYEVEVKHDYRGCLCLTVHLRTGSERFSKHDFIIHYSEDGAGIAYAIVTDAVVKLIKTSIESLSVLSKLVTTLRETGLQVSSINCGTLCKSYTVSFTYSDVAIEVVGAYSLGNVTLTHIKVPVSHVGKYISVSRLRKELSKRCSTRGLDTLAHRFSNEIVGLDINTYDKEHTHLKILNVPLEQVKPLAEVFRETVRDEEKRVGELYASLDPASALALGLFICEAGYELEQYLNEHYGVDMISLVEDRAKEYIKQLGIFYIEPIRSIIRDAGWLLSKLYEKGRLTIDSDGYLVLDGRRIIDVVKNYVGAEDVVVAGNKTIIVNKVEEALMLRFLMKADIDLERACSGSVPRRLLDILTSPNTNSAIKEKYASLIVKYPYAWFKLPRGDKVLVLASNLDLVNQARENGWTWVFEDPYIVAEAIVNGKPPAVATKLLAKLFPEFIGNRFEVVQIGGQPFIMMRNVFLQVMRVQGSTVVVAGTLGTSKVGMVVRRKTVADAAKTIAENFVDTLIEFKEITNKLRSRQDVGVKTLRIAFFSVPVITMRTRYGTVKKIPLQPRIKSILAKRYLISADTDEETAMA